MKKRVAANCWLLSLFLFFLLVFGMQEVGGIQIKKRINARKIMLSYLYQHRFFLNMQKSIEKPEIRPQESIEVQLQD